MFALAFDHFSDIYLKISVLYLKLHWRTFYFHNCALYPQNDVIFILIFYLISSFLVIGNIYSGDKTYVLKLFLRAVIKWDRVGDTAFWKLFSFIVPISISFFKYFFIYLICSVLRLDTAPHILYIFLLTKYTKKRWCVQSAFIQLTDFLLYT